MDEIIKVVVEKTGISEELAKKVVVTVLNYLDDKLPSPIGGNLQGFLDNEQTIDTIENIAKGLGGFFNKTDK
ncbi:MAG: hypothetical protein J7L73_02415 [Anaerolineales bacterium]|nr:hypothetical protein [Anaerolineales bacterium]